MDKKLVLAVAGSGKTSLLVEKLNLEERFLLITYTINNTANLKRAIVRKFGYFPENIQLNSYYKFLYSVCFRPFLGYKTKARGIYWKPTPRYTNFKESSDLMRYMSKQRYLYHNRIAKLIEHQGIIREVANRLEKYYDHIFIDEVQDFAGHDFNLLTNILSANINFLLVGDFYQHTFDTSRDGKTNSNLHKKLDGYLERFKKENIEIDTQYLNKSHRCTPEVCEFISTRLEIQIESHKEKESQVEFVSDAKEIERLFSDDTIIKLFYQNSTKYAGYTRNWGDCKGEEYKDVCVVLNKTTYEHYKNNDFQELKPTTKNKLYVACSRAYRNLFFISEDEIKHHKQLERE